MSDPLSPSALAQVPDVRDHLERLAAKQAEYDRAIDRAHVDDDDQDYRDRLASEVDATGFALLAAVRDAVLQAERQRLLGMTPEVREVVQSLVNEKTGLLTFAGYPEDEARQEAERRVAGILAVIRAPEVAKREAAERERDEVRRFMAEELRELNELYDGEVALNAGIAGNFRCDECEFVLQKNTLNTKTGALGVFPLHVLEDCPNGCGSMRGSTWRDLCFDARKACDAFTEWMLAAEAERDRLKAALEKYGSHGASCAAAYSAAPCDCGYSAALGGAE